MKKPMLYTALVAIFCAASHEVLAADTPISTIKPEANATQLETTAPTPPNPAKIDCNYNFSPTSRIDNATLIPWAERATQQSFNFKYDAIDKQLAALKACYTDQGWQSFNDALQKSGNVSAITSQKLTVSTSISGSSTLTEVKENQWKVNIPVEVLYQNERDKITQSLNVELLVGRKQSGSLGIMQIVVSPSKEKDSASKDANNSTDMSASTKNSVSTGKETPKN